MRGRTFRVGRTPWSARVHLDPLFAQANQPHAIPERPTGEAAANHGVRPRLATAAVTSLLLLATPLLATTPPKKPAAPVIGPPRPVSFRLDVMPVLFRAGCNSGGCHGAAICKDGFHLSLFGYDPAGDYYRLTQQIPGRRIDLAVPEQSLLLLKAIGAVPHSGGRRFKHDTEYCNNLPT